PGRTARDRPETPQRLAPECKQGHLVGAWVQGRAPYQPVEIPAGPGRSARRPEGRRGVDLPVPIRCPCLHPAAIKVPLLALDRAGGTRATPRELRRPTTTARGQQESVRSALGWIVRSAAGRPRSAPGSGSTAPGCDAASPSASPATTSLRP